MRNLIKGVSGKLFIINSLTATAYAFILPIMSIYLIDGIGASPSFIAYYSVSFALSGMFFSQLFGSLADKGVNDRWLFLISIICIVISAASFIFVTEPWQALAVGTILMGPGNACIPLILSMIKRFADQSGQNITSLNTQMRSGVSVVWIAGPALAFIVADSWGYIANFYIAFTLAIFVIILTTKYLPTFNKAVETPSPLKSQPSTIPTIALILGLVILLGNLANHVYITAMPLYLTQELSIPMYFPGLLLGVTAMFEIPVMLYAAKFSEKFGKSQLMVFGFICAVIYYLLIQYVTTIPLLILSQAFNGLFYGVFVGLGITLIQDAFPNKGGMASAYYTNMMRIGMMLGTSVAGFIAQYFNFKTALYASLASASLSLILIVYMSKIPALKSIKATI
ncbi:sugar efflux transporter [Vibrio lentus]|uniref:sugar efflux transporter n=1 Tax=Vibrio lentus TaxID=136468 RepID=UPI000C83BE38|nr:sugar efflux transporter [Vibrio lentus]PMI43947.1 MFS transporter [Vibrio lentus]PMJ53992.1 MFS transporter [Vibrio lentus]